MPETSWWVLTILMTYIGLYLGMWYGRETPNQKNEEIENEKPTTIDY
jgi:hypothetical protein